MSSQAGLFEHDQADEYLLKHVNAVALMPTAGGRRISVLGRKLFNVLLFRAQEEGEREEYEARLHEVLSDAAYNSNDTAPIRKILRELMSTTVEWQSPSNGEIETWDACNLLSGAGTTKDKRTKAVTVRWRFDSKIRAQLLSPDRYARLSLEAITQLTTHSAMDLYEICARYVDNPGHKTARQHWRWWKPVLTGVVGDDLKSEYRFFKRDVLNKAIAEINECTNLVVRGPIEYKERDNKTIAEIQFEVRLKGSEAPSTPVKPPLEDVGVNDLPLVGRAINSGVKQFEAEALIRKYGPAAFAAAVAELEKRLKMPSDKVGVVAKPGGWLRAHMSNMRPAVASPQDAKPELTEVDLKKHRAAWTDEWLRRRKERLQLGFQELPTADQAAVLGEFRADLVQREQAQVLKRLDMSGWQHRMVVAAFLRFYGTRIFGDDWDKPSADQLLAVAAEMGAA